MKSFHCIVEGRVQGVGFRHFVMMNAQSLNITGWVRNLYNGNVEVQAEGNYDNLHKLVSKIKSGPPSSFVSNCKVDWSETIYGFERFQVRSTY